MIRPVSRNSFRFWRRKYSHPTNASKSIGRVIAGAGLSPESLHIVAGPLFELLSACLEIGVEIAGIPYRERPGRSIGKQAPTRNGADGKGVCFCVVSDGPQRR